jgi:hypothetical protein
VSFHGSTEDGRPDILIGAACRLTAGGHNGIQIEQQRRARAGTISGSNLPRWQAIAAAVADVYRVILTAGAWHLP